MGYKLAVDKEDIDLKIENIKIQLTEGKSNPMKDAILQTKLDIYKTILKYPMYEDNEWNK